MALAILQLADPLIEAMVTLLEANLNATIASLSATNTDAYNPAPVAQFVPYIPTPAGLQGGLPAVGVGELETMFVNDLQSSMDAVHTYAVMAIVQNADHRTLTVQLRRTMQAIAYTIQQDRLQGNAQGSGGIMRDQGNAWSVNFLRSEPGPLLGEMDPVSSDAPPRSYLSWTALVLSSERTEI